MRCLLKADPEKWIVNPNTESKVREHDPLGERAPGLRLSGRTVYLRGRRTDITPAQTDERHPDGEDKSRERGKRRSTETSEWSEAARGGEPHGQGET